MGFLFFYLNALKENRLETFKFLLSLQHHVRKNDNVLLGLPTKFHEYFTPAIGDIVLYYAKKFRKGVALAARVQDIVSILRSEDDSGISDDRDSLLRRAKDELLNDNFRIFTSKPDPQRYNYFASNSTYAIEDTTRNVLSIAKDLNILPSSGNYSKSSILTPAMMEIRNFVDFYGLHLKNDNSESFFKFFGCVWALILEVDVLSKNDPIVFILGETERKLYDFRGIVPSFQVMDKYAKLLLSVEQSLEKYVIDEDSKHFLRSVDQMLEECATPQCI